MTAANRSAQLTKLHKVLRKHYEPATVPSGRTVLEHLLFACCLENSRHADVEDVFARLTEAYFDWNEVRVTTVTELAEVMASLIDPVDSARRLKTTLQSIFETHYAFDIDALRKQNLGKSIKDIERYKGMTPFILAYVTQNALGGHAIPINQGLMEAFMMLGMVAQGDVEEGRLPGLERAIPKNKGSEFASLVHQFGVDYKSNPSSSKVRSIVQEMVPEGVDTTAKRVAKKPSGSVAATLGDANQAESARSQMKATKSPSQSASEKRPGASPTESESPASDTPASGTPASAIAEATKPEAKGGTKEPRTKTESAKAVPPKAVPPKAGPSKADRPKSGASPIEAEKAASNTQLPKGKVTAKSTGMPAPESRSVEDAMPPSTKRPAAKGESPKAESVRSETAKSESAKSESAKTDSGRGESAKRKPETRGEAEELSSKKESSGTKLPEPSKTLKASSSKSSVTKWEPGAEAADKSAATKASPGGKAADKKSSEVKSGGGKGTSKAKEDASDSADDRGARANGNESKPTKNRPEAAGSGEDVSTSRGKSAESGLPVEKVTGSKKSVRKPSPAQVPPADEEVVSGSVSDAELEAEQTTSATKRLSRKKPR